MRPRVGVNENENLASLTDLGNGNAQVVHLLPAIDRLSSDNDAC